MQLSRTKMGRRSRQQSSQIYQLRGGVALCPLNRRSRGTLMMHYVLMTLYTASCIVDIRYGSRYSRALVRVSTLAMFAYILTICMQCGMQCVR